MAQQSTPDAVDAAARGTHARGSPSRPTASTSSPRPSARARPRQLFWPWFGANVSVFGLAYGSFLLGFGISFWQAIVAGVVGIVVSFLLCGLVAHRRQARLGADPRAQPGRVRRQRQPRPVGALLGADRRLGDGAGLAGDAGDRAGLRPARLEQRGGDQGRRAAGRGRARRRRRGPRLRRRSCACRRRSPGSTGILTVVYIVLVADHMDWSAVSALPSGSTAAFIGALVLAMTGYGFGWVNAAADYSRYLPRTASTRGVVGWTTFGGALAPVVLLIAGLLLAGSDSELSRGHRARPDRRPRHAPADLVPRAVHPRRGARPHRRRAARHLLVGPVAARGRAAGAPAGGGDASTAR